MKIKLCGKTAIFVPFSSAFSHCVPCCPVDSVLVKFHGVPCLSQILRFEQKIETQFYTRGRNMVQKYFE